MYSYTGPDTVGPNETLCDLCYKSLAYQWQKDTCGGMGSRFG